MGDSALEDARRRPVGWAAFNPHPDEKAGWRSVSEGILPSPALSSRQNPLHALASFVGDRLGFSSSLSTKHSGPLTARAEQQAASWLHPSWSTIRFMLLCSIWYTSSAMSSNTGKVIMNAYRYPVTLTIIQFFFVSSYSALCCQPVFGITTMRRPTRAIVRSTLPMAVFQVGGHVFSSVAISRIPVSTVHTIKALSPMFTVAAYAALFGVKYSAATYISLLPLTLGVMLACSFDVSASDFVGLLSAFCSAIVFVSSNIFFKKVMPTPTEKGGSSGLAPAHKLDKLNLLLYSSGFAFLLMIPIWVFSDLPALWSGTASSTAKNSDVSVAYYYFLNGTVHFGQNLIAFIILSSTSPVTYSIAALVKRIAVICIAVVWFAQHVHPIQGLGIGLTFVGLWMYNNAKKDVERGEKQMRKVEAGHLGLLPNTAREADVYRGRSPVDDGMAANTITSAVATSPSQEMNGGLAPFALSSAVPRPAYIQQSSAIVPPTIHSQPPHSHSHAHVHPPPPPPPHAHAHPPPLSARQHAPPPLNLSALEQLKAANGGHALTSPTGSYPSPPPSVGPVSPPPRPSVFGGRTVSYTNGGGEKAD